MGRVHWNFLLGTNNKETSGHLASFKSIKDIKFSKDQDYADANCILWCCFAVTLYKYLINENAFHLHGSE